MGHQARGLNYSATEEDVFGYCSLLLCVRTEATAGAEHDMSASVLSSSSTELLRVNLMTWRMIIMIIGLLRLNSGCCPPRSSPQDDHPKSTGPCHADVLATSDGVWRVSYSGTGSYQELRTADVEADRLLVADVDGDGQDDIFTTMEMAAD